MSLRINDEAPNFSIETAQGWIDFHEWVGNRWVILFSHPKDITPVCTTELGYMAGLKPEFDGRGCKIIGSALTRSSITSVGRRTSKKPRAMRSHLPADRRQRTQCRQALRHATR
jgi:alkyl hydroperoxide reductase subunit AhpC